MQLSKIYQPHYHTGSQYIKNIFIDRKKGNKPHKGKSQTVQIALADLYRQHNLFNKKKISLSKLRKYSCVIGA